MNKFSIVSVGYNCEPYIKKCLKSIVNQTYNNWECIIQLDPSTDNSYKKLLEVIDDDERFKIEYNTKRKYCLHNTYDCVQKADNDECIIVCMDLDDAFYTPKALEIINNEYKKHDCWLTYGNYIDSNGSHGYWCRPILNAVWEANTHRKSIWSASVLRSFKVWLFNKINPEDFLMPNGKWIKRATDRAFMYPMLEMAGKKRVRFIKEFLYWYRIYGQQASMNNIENECLKHILSKVPYNKLEEK